MVASKTLGPWNKGLNLTSNRDLSVFLDNNELGEATNVIFSPEGFVEPRPGFKKFLYDFGTYDTIEVIGELELPNGSTVVFVQTVTGTAPTRQAKVYTITDKDTVALVYTPAVNTVFKHVMSYQSIAANHTGVFLFADQAAKSVKNDRLDLAGTWSVINTNYAVPASNKGFLVKDRLFLFDYLNSKMWWSPANYILDFNNVDKANYGIDEFSEEPIEATIQEDGIRAVEFHNNNFYIFKKSKTFMFTYQALPGEDGYLRKVSDNMGAFDSTMFHDNIVVINSKGVYRLDGTQFLDLQRQIDFRFEIPIDHLNIKEEDIFITDFNEDILFGFNDIISGAGQLLRSSVSNTYYFCMNGNNGAWSKWDFNYVPNVCAPGAREGKAQGPASTEAILVFNTFDRKHLVYTDYKPRATLPEYHMDTLTTETTSHTKFYIPPVDIKTSANFGDSPLRFVKLYRTYIRFYMSDIPRDQVAQGTTLWTISINYNSYKFEYDTRPDGNPIFTLHPSGAVFAEQVMTPGTGASGITTLYQRTYQIPIPQQRAREFVVELKRAYSELTAPLSLSNTDADRPIENGYYFMLSAIWVDYQDKQGI